MKFTRTVLHYSPVTNGNASLPFCGIFSSASIAPCLPNERQTSTDMSEPYTQHSQFQTRLLLIGLGANQLLGRSIMCHYIRNLLEDPYILVECHISFNRSKPEISSLVSAPVGAAKLLPYRKSSVETLIPSMLSFKQICLQKLSARFFVQFHSGLLGSCFPVLLTLKIVPVRNHCDIL